MSDTALIITALAAGVTALANLVDSIWGTRKIVKQLAVEVPHIGRRVDRLDAHLGLNPIAKDPDATA